MISIGLEVCVDNLRREKPRLHAHDQIVMEEKRIFIGKGKREVVKNVPT